MKITKEMLKKLIKEEMSQMSEMGSPRGARDAAMEVMQVIEKHTGKTVDLDVVMSMLMNHESVGMLFR